MNGSKFDVSNFNTTNPEDFTPKWVQKLGGIAGIIMDPGGAITDSITKGKTFNGTPLKLKEVASTAFNIAIQTAIAAVGMGIACIFVSATWPVITAIALAGVAAAALVIGITCISIACYQANKEVNNSDTNNNSEPTLPKGINKNSQSPRKFDPLRQQILRVRQTLMKRAYSDQQAEEHGKEAKKNLRSIKAALQNQNGINSDEINNAIKALSENAICLASIAAVSVEKFETFIRNCSLNTELSNGQTEPFNANQTTLPAYLNDIRSDDPSTIQSGIKVALGLDKILQEENGESQDIQTILANIEKVEEQIDAVVKNVENSRDY